MNGYAASARLAGRSPRLGSIVTRGGDDGLPRAELVDAPPALVVGRDDAAGSPFAERIAAFRERWAQLTFYLFDPESWR